MYLCNRETCKYFSIRVHREVYTCKYSSDISDLGASTSMHAETGMEQHSTHNLFSSLSQAPPQVQGLPEGLSGIVLSHADVHHALATPTPLTAWSLKRVCSQGSLSSPLLRT